MAYIDWDYGDWAGEAFVNTTHPAPGTTCVAEMAPYEIIGPTFTVKVTLAMQTRGTNPSLYTNVKAKPVPKPKGKG